MLRIKQIDGKDYLFCVWRQKYVRLTPEEWVRQQFLHALVAQGYPEHRIGVEQQIAAPAAAIPSAVSSAAASAEQLTKRCDAIIYDPALQPVCIIEFKAPTVALTQKVFDQVSIYNRRLRVAYFILSNGHVHQACRVTPAGYIPLSSIPSYEELCQKE